MTTLPLRTLTLAVTPGIRNAEQWWQNWRRYSRSILTLCRIAIRRARHTSL